MFKRKTYELMLAHRTFVDLLVLKPFLMTLKPFVIGCFWSCELFLS